MTVDTITTIKDEYKVQKYWTGDPCSPRKFPWDGLRCSRIDGSANFRIVSLKLSSSGLTGKISTSFGSLSELELLDLSNNKLTGGVPDALANLIHLKLLDLSENDLNGYIPKALLDRNASGTLTLRIGLRGEKKSTNKTVIAIAVSISVVVLLGLIIIFILHRRKKSGKKTQLRSSSSTHVGSNQFTADDLIRITHNFDKEIGRGGYGSVYYGVLGDTTEVAVKKLSRSSSQGSEQFMTEAHILTRIYHRNLVSFIGSCDDSDNLSLVYEYMAKGSLKDHLTGEFGSALNWEKRLQISVEAAQGLEYLHVGCKPAIIHRDVKTRNILLNNKLEAKISDFGLSKLFQDDFYTHISTSPVGTLGYIDPLYYSTGMLNEKSDVYSFGVVLLELVTGLPAVLKNPENINLNHWVKTRVGEGKLDEIIDRRIYGECDINSVRKVVETALICASPEPLQRPTMTKVLMLLRECFEMLTADAKNTCSAHE